MAILLMVLFVELSVFLLAIVSPLPGGSLALLYHLKLIASYYPRRGGTSGDGVFCGIYYTDYSASDSIIRWFIGAAL